MAGDEKPEKERKPGERDRARARVYEGGELAVGEPRTGEVASVGVLMTDVTF